ncbi:hypothetical protein FQA47_010793 [Oryzias melastigma]|uniref:Uncharacterized protein n=1 Tax=Oryzias melastigma TaxID=30732 RepID=A0A834FH97_ORYME|nr:hypothetical protein FQA47_010793 [Oryzias melastigma]
MYDYNPSHSYIGKKKIKPTRNNLNVCIFHKPNQVFDSVDGKKSFSWISLATLQQMLNVYFSFCLLTIQTCHVARKLQFLKGCVAPTTLKKRRKKKNLDLF